jgi:mannose-1-phosphate guanylyltransferase/phosphomannomutase
MVLAAGHGTRLGVLTAEIPKPMLDIAGKPLIERILLHLHRHGVGEAAINLHFHGEHIRGHLGNGARVGLALRYSIEPTLLGTAGGLLPHGDFLRGSDAFLVQYGDILTDADLSAMVAQHRRTGAIATVMLHRRAGSNSMVQMAEDGRITAFLERPAEGERPAWTDPWVNSGIAVCSPELLDLIPRGRPADLPRDVFAPLAGSGRLFGMPLQGYRCAVDSPERLERLRADVAAGKVMGMAAGKG